MKKVAELPTCTAGNSNGKWGPGAMTDAGEANNPADTAELTSEIVLSRATEYPSPHTSPSPLTSTLSDNEAAMASEWILMEASAQDLLTLASETKQHPRRSATQASMPSSNHSSSDPCFGNVLALPVAEAR